MTLIPRDLVALTHGSTAAFLDRVDEEREWSEME